MRIFEQGNWISGVVCPICKTGKKGPVVLVPIPGTEDGGTVEAQQVHTSCAELVATTWIEAEKNNE